MFNPNSILIDAFVAHTSRQFVSAFPNAETEQVQALHEAVRTALEILLNCDCPYHDAHHTILVTEAGQAILQGRQLAHGDLTSHLWLQAVVGMLFHDTGYVRNLLADDTAQSCVINFNGDHVDLPIGSTDAFMMPYHVDRAAMYVRERFGNVPAIDTGFVAQCIEMTRFPVPSAPQHQVTDSIPALVRAADLVGQMADPQYLQKLPRLFAELVETGDAAYTGLRNSKELRDRFPSFFHKDVRPYIRDGITYLMRTQEGQLWVANLYRHLHVDAASEELDPRVYSPELVVNNQLAS